MAEGSDMDRNTDAPRTSRGMRVVLILSLGFNLLVVGLVAGLWLSEGPPGRAGGPPGADFVRALPEADRAALFRDLRAERRAARAAQADAAARLLAVLRADPFAPAALSEVLGGIEAQGQAVRLAGQRALVERVAAMSAEERAVYADRLEVRLAGRSRR